MPGVAQHGHGFAPVEHTVAGGAVADTPAQEPVFTGKGLSGDHTGGQNDGFGIKQLLCRLDGKEAGHGVDGGNLLFENGNIQTVQLVQHGIGHFAAADSGKTGIVEDFLGLLHFFAEAAGAEEQNGLAPDFSGDGRRYAPRPGADDGDVHWIHGNPSLSAIELSSIRLYTI